MKRLALVCLVASCAPAKAADETSAAAVVAQAASHASLRVTTHTTSPLARALPERTTTPLHLELPDEPAFFAELRPLDVVDVRAERVGSSRVFRAARDATDLLYVVDRDRVEELRLLRDGAATTARWSLRVSASVADVRLREGRVELLDRSGKVRLSSAPMFAIDARGVRRDLDVTLHGAGSEREIVARLDARGLARPIVVDPSWSTVASMAHARTDFTMTVLPTGKVLVAGGFDGAAYLSSAELYDPSANTWSSTGSMTTARYGHTATLLADGRVVVLGGNTSSAEVWSAGTWTSLGSMLASRFQHTATLLSGKILVVGGEGSTAGDAEMFDPATGTSVSAGTPPSRNGGVAFLLASGKVLVVGGMGTTARGADLYDPATKTWSSGGSMVYPRYEHDGVVLPSGKILINGGRGAVETATIGPEMYDPATNAWTALTIAGAERRQLASVLLKDGRPLFIGGNSLATAPSSELFDPTTSSWIDAGALATLRAGHRAVRFDDGRVLVAGGVTSTSVRLSSAELFALQPLGAVCTRGGECASGFCVDSVCCNSACTGQCEACDGATKGTCGPVSGAPHGARTACSSGAGDPCKDQRCDGVDRTACHYPPAGTPACSSAACVDGIETHPSTCNGLGACSDVATSCDPYACGGTICKTMCASSTDCAPGARCTGTACVTLPGLGESCTGPSTCNAGLFCVDGVCCGVAACPAGSSCAAGPKKGVCAKLAGTSCTKATECGSGFCADGVCCDAACDGQCEACDIPDATGRKGKCLPVKGAPHAGHMACEADTTNVCASKTCEGTTRTSCAGLVADETPCRPQSCADGTQTLAASCDGKGACPAAVTASCSGFRCDDAGKTCKTACATVADCIDGFDCVGTICKRRTASCSPDGKEQIDAVTGAPTDCAPYVCVAGACRTECATTSDCQSGVCQDKKCIAPTPAGGAEESGGCAFGHARTGGATAGALVALLLLSRRRRSPRFARER